jgi:hypothetical protein
MSTDLEGSTEQFALVTRREALRRVLVLLGGTVSAPTLAALLAACQGGEQGARKDTTAPCSPP